MVTNILTAHIRIHLMGLLSSMPNDLKVENQSVFFESSPSNTPIAVDHQNAMNFVVRDDKYKAFETAQISIPDPDITELKPHFTLAKLPPCNNSTR